MRRTEFTDFPFDKEAFKEMLIKARGERTQREFSKDCALSYAYLNKYANGKMEDPPTIGTIKKIAVATRAVSYEELLLQPDMMQKNIKKTDRYGQPEKICSIR